MSTLRKLKKMRRVIKHVTVGRDPVISSTTYLCKLEIQKKNNKDIIELKKQHYTSLADAGLFRTEKFIREDDSKGRIKFRRVYV